MTGLQNENRFLRVTFGNVDFSNFAVGKCFNERLEPGADFTVLKELVGRLIDHVAFFVTDVDINVFAGQVDLFGLTTAQAQHQRNETVAPTFRQSGELFGRAFDRHKAQRAQHHVGLRIGIKGFTRQGRAARLARIHAKAQINLKVSRTFPGAHVNFRFYDASEQHLGSLRQKRINADHGMRHGRVGRSGLAMRQSTKFQIENR